MISLLISRNNRSLSGGFSSSIPGRAMPCRIIASASPEVKILRPRARSSFLSKNNPEAPISTGFFTEARTGIPSFLNLDWSVSLSSGTCRPAASRVSLRATPQDPPMVRIATRLPSMGGRSMRACPNGSRSSIVGEIRMSA